MLAFLRHTVERERLDSFIITLSCCLWTDAHVHQPSWSSLASVLWKCKVITGVYLGQKKRTQFQAQTLFLCCFSMVYFWLQNSSLSVPNPLLREWAGSSLCLSVYCLSLSLSLCLSLWSLQTTVRKKDVQRFSQVFDDSSRILYEQEDHLLHEVRGALILQLLELRELIIQQALQINQILLLRTQL
jgi:hypothetical protein